MPYKRMFDRNISEFSKILNKLRVFYLDLHYHYYYSICRSINTYYLQYCTVSEKMTIYSTVPLQSSSYREY